MKPPLLSAGLLPLKIVPIAILVVFAGLTAILGLAARAEGRRYASRIVEVTLAAACALAAGEHLQLHPARRPGTKQITSIAG